MNLSESRVSIGMPICNGEKQLEESILRIFELTHKGSYLYAADNASSDRTEEICRDDVAKDKRIKYISNEYNLGASKNFTACFKPTEDE